MGALLRGAATASMISSARTNRAKRRHIEQATQQAAPAPQATPAPAAPAQSDMAVQLAELNNLKNQGILTQEEFDAKKKQILGI